MPVQRCMSRGRPGYKWGSAGKCYVYTPGNIQSKVAAREKAAKQGQAIKAREEK